jgi:hypothetical protein
MHVYPVLLDLLPLFGVAAVRTHCEWQIQSLLFPGYACQVVLSPEYCIYLLLDHLHRSLYLIFPPKISRTLKCLPLPLYLILKPVGYFCHGT